ncbi:hypothetical protein E2C01_078500 [Portunus trituberculatus]|uniref:Uncharacterized protein n=1 Tax=Portunus trituberculatus TaxID=210409 RepID=A0A5B7IUA5_PORTR|nr:hypothetical protein [Portunus trituberculatus]
MLRSESTEMDVCGQQVRAGHAKGVFNFFVISVSLDKTKIWNPPPCCLGQMEEEALRSDIVTEDYLNSIHSRRLQVHDNNSWI